MKFIDTYEFRLFLIENGLGFDLDKNPADYVIPDNINEGLFIKKQRVSLGYKDSRKASDTEGQWRGMRYKMMSAIKRYHKSIEGKRMHRKLARFLSTKEPLKNMSMLTMRDTSEMIGDLDCLASDMTKYYHSYYHPDADIVEALNLKEDVTDKIELIIGKLVINDNLSIDDTDFIRTILNAESYKTELHENFNIADIGQTWSDTRLDALRYMSVDNPALNYEIYRHIISTTSK